ncbi:hypothetical protein FB446DRAFT_703808 [Lentinula raphanica]|nr:hypothetical protein FB446DRAFT_703808 [Lentinula raphanica]
MNGTFSVSSSHPPGILALELELERSYFLVLNTEMVSNQKTSWIRVLLEFLYNTTLGEIGVVVYTAFTGVQPLGGRHIIDEQLRDLRHLSIPAFPPIIEGGNDLIGKIMERLELES